jgi:protein-S-isoprenylcysteine O-methyltransferase Ste14
MDDNLDVDRDTICRKEHPTAKDIEMTRPLFFVYGVTCHLLFLATFAYMAGFMGNLPWLPFRIDSRTGDSMGAAIAINLVLMALFGVSHSVMARPGFKRVWTKIVLQPIERATYVLVSCIVIFVMMWQWRAIDTIVWDPQSPVVRGVLWTLFAAGWLMVPLVSLMIDHFDLFGTRQVWLYLKNRQYEAKPFRTPLLYGNVRHPLYLGWALAFWATPTMTVGHLLFAGVLTGYMIIAAVIEERDLVEHFGEQYRAYRKRVPMFVPKFRASVEDESE